SEIAVLNANYVLAKLRGAYDLPFDRLCMHEFVLSARRLKREHGITALDVAKRLMDYGFHPPTIYFPLVVPEALMIEPTETEAKETLDAFADAMLAIAREAAEEPETVKGAPYTRPVKRLDEVKADEQLAYENVAALAEHAAGLGNFVRIDMEESRWVDATLRIYRRLRESGHENTGTVLQAYLYRTEADLESLLGLRPNLRLVKGAY